MKTEASQSLSYVAPVLRVSDIARSLAFYSDRLGFAVEFVYESFYAGVCRDGCHIHLKGSPPPPRDEIAFEREEHIDIYIGVQSAEALSERLALQALHLLSHCATCHMGQSSTSAIQMDTSWVSLSPTPTST